MQQRHFTIWNCNLNFICRIIYYSALSLKYVTASICLCWGKPFNVALGSANKTFLNLNIKKKKILASMKLEFFVKNFKVIDFKIGTFLVSKVSLFFSSSKSISFSATKAKNCHYFETIWTYDHPFRRGDSIKVLSNEVGL